MSRSISPAPDPTAIGGIPKALFALTPDPLRLFGRRAARFAALAESSDLAPYLTFLSGVSRVQAEVAAVSAPPSPLHAAQVDRALAHGMPPVDRSRLPDDPAFMATLSEVLAGCAALPMPAPAAEALARLRTAPPGVLARMLAPVLTEAPADADLAAVVFLAAGAQVQASRIAATLPAARLLPIGTGLCPACGGRPLASLVVGFQGAEGARYAVCGLCATMWNEVRIKCLTCGSTKGIGYRAVEGDADATVKAEVCDECRSWLKIMYQNANPSLDALADDIGTLGLDILMRDTDYRRAGFDPFLVGY